MSDEPTPRTPDTPCYTHVLSDDEKRELLRIARSTLRELVATGKMPPGAPHRQVLVDPATVVLRLTAGERARVRGRGEAGGPVYKAIQEACAQVVRGQGDRQGRPLKADELPDLTMTLAILGAASSVGAAGDLVVGTHVLAAIGPSGRHTYLPEEVVAARLTAEELLTEAAKAVGASDGNWRAPGVAMQAISAQVFAEPLVLKQSFAFTGR